MSVVSAVVLVLLIHGSCAVRCYLCRSKTTPDCDDPFRNSSDIHTLKCPGNACVKAKGRAKDDVWYTGVWRGCATAAMVDCTTVTNEPVPELHLTDATVEMCYCTGHLCNAARRRHVLVGGGTAAGGVIVAALLALAGARFVGA